MKVNPKHEFNLAQACRQECLYFTKDLTLKYVTLNTTFALGWLTYSGVYQAHFSPERDSLLTAALIFA